MREGGFNIKGRIAVESWSFSVAKPSLAAIWRPARLPFAGFRALHGGLRQVCKRRKTRGFAKVAQTAAFPCKPGVGRHPFLQKRHRLPWAFASPSFAAITICKAVTARHFRRSFWRKVFFAENPANAVYCHPMICGCRQVVRPELPKLVFAGSSPVTRSIDCIGSGARALPFYVRAGIGTRTDGVEFR